MRHERSQLKLGVNEACLDRNIESRRTDGPKNRSHEEITEVEYRHRPRASTHCEHSWISSHPCLLGLTEFDPIIDTLLDRNKRQHRTYRQRPDSSCRWVVSDQAVQSIPSRSSLLTFGLASESERKANMPAFFWSTDGPREELIFGSTFVHRLSSCLPNGWKVSEKNRRSFNIFCDHDNTAAG